MSTPMDMTEFRDALRKLVDDTPATRIETMMLAYAYSLAPLEIQVKASEELRADIAELEASK